MIHEADIVIVGAGIMGASLALHLRSPLSGSVPGVIVLEREDEPALHSSGRGAGMVRQLYRHPQLTDWAYRTIRSLPDGIRDTHFEQTGSLILGREAPLHHRSLFAARTVCGRPAVYSLTDGLVTPGRLTRAVADLASEAGAKFLFGERVTEFDERGGSFYIGTEKRLTIRARRLVNASGAWLNDFLPKPLRLPVGAYARHLFEVQSEGSKTPCEEHNVGFYWDEAEGFYLRRFTKRSFLFSLCDQDAAQPDTYAAPENIEARAALRLVELGLPSAILRSWNGFRTYAADQLPIFGEDLRPGAPKNLFWLGAFGGFGISTGFAAAEDAARLLSGKLVGVPTDFSPERFQATSPAQATDS